MPFIPIDENEIDVGDPLKKELFDKVKTDLDDHEERVASLETGAKRVVVFDLTVKNAASASTMTGLAYSEATMDFLITGCELRIFEKGSLTGALEIDIKKSTTGMDSTDFTSIFAGKPRIPMAFTTDYGRSDNQLFNHTQTQVNVGDTLRLDVTVMPTNGVMGKFRVLLYGEV